MSQVIGPEEIETLLIRLNKYYAQLESHCNKAAAYVAALHGNDVHQAASLYSALCDKLIRQIGVDIRYKRYALFPFMRQLSAWEQGGYPPCSGGRNCRMQYARLLAVIRKAQGAMQETMVRLSSVVFSYNRRSVNYHTYQSLRREINHICRQLEKLLRYEKEALTPLIKITENNIHADH